MEHDLGLRLGLELGLRLQLRLRLHLGVGLGLPRLGLHTGYQLRGLAASALRHRGSTAL